MRTLGSGAWSWSRIVRAYVPAAALAAFLAPWAVWGWRLPAEPSTPHTPAIGVLVLLLFVWAVVWWMLAVDFVIAFARFWLTNWIAVLPTRLGVVATYGALGALVGGSWAEVAGALDGLTTEQLPVGFAVGSLVGVLVGAVAALVTPEGVPGEIVRFGPKEWQSSDGPLPEDPDLDAIADRLRKADHSHA